MDNGLFFEANGWLRKYTGIGAPLSQATVAQVFAVTGRLDVRTYSFRDRHRDRVTGDILHGRPYDWASAKASVSGYLIVFSTDMAVDVFSVSPDPSSRSDRGDPTNDTTLRMTQTDVRNVFVPTDYGSWERFPHRSFENPKLRRFTWWAP